MATITINISDELNQKFREVVKEDIGEGKGTIGKGVEEAINYWIKEKKQLKIRDEAIQLLDKGFKMGKITAKSRDELHER